MQPQALSTAEPIKAAAATARAVSTHGRTLPQEPTKALVQYSQQALASIGTSAWSACFRTKKKGCNSAKTSPECGACILGYLPACAQNNQRIYGLPPYYIRDPLADTDTLAEDLVTDTTAFCHPRYDYAPQYKSIAHANTHLVVLCCTC